MILEADGAGPLFQFGVIPWPKFRESVMLRDWEHPALRDANVVFCGVDLTIDFM